MPSKYDEQAHRLAKAIDIAAEVVRESTDFNDQLKKAMLDFGKAEKRLILFPEQRFRKIASLKQTESDFFTFWNEASGRDVEKFWTRILESNLGFVRRDTFHDVLKRRKIKNRSEFDVITDNIVVYQQTGRISQEQVIELNKYLGEFEKKKGGR
jgi:hypothetical protein